MVRKFWVKEQVGEHWAAPRVRRANLLRTHPVATAFITCLAIVITVFAAIGIWRLIGSSSGSSFGALPSGVTKQVTGFKVYYLKPTFSTDFVLQPNSVTYQSGVLEFSMKDSIGKVLTFTEEHTPKGRDMLQGLIGTSQQTNTEFGQGFVVDNSGGTQGTLFMYDGTWVIVNAPQSIGDSLMQQVLNNLDPQ